MQPRSPSATRLALALAALAFALAAAPAAPAVAEAPRHGGSPTARARAAAGPLTAAEYAARVARAREVAASAARGGVTVEEASEVSGEVSALLPDGERVEGPGGEVVVVDASVVGALASRLDASRTDRAREEALGSLRAQLDALASAASGASGSAAGVRSDSAALRTLLARREGGRTSVLADEIAKGARQFAEWVAKRLFGALSPRTSSRLSATAWVVMIVLLTAVLAFIGWRAAIALRASVSRRQRAAAVLADAGVPVVAAAEGLPDDALAYAEELAAAGRYREAVRALFGGAARTLVEAGLIAQTRTRTDAELLAEVAPVSPAAHPPLAQLTRAFEFAWYGHADPGAAGFAEARSRYADVVRTVAA